MDGDASGNKHAWKGRDYWVCNVCPAADDCSEQAFERARCWGWTLGECQNRVYKHLQSSGNYAELKNSDRQLLTDIALYEEMDGKSEYVHSCDDGEEASKPQPLAPTPKSKVKRKYPDQIKPDARATPATSSSGDTVTLSVATLDLMLDTIERARSGLEHARKILESGALAFQRAATSICHYPDGDTLAALFRRCCESS